MRADSPKRYNVTTAIVLITASVDFGLPTSIKMAVPKQKEVVTEVTTLSQLEEPEIKQEEMKRVEPVASPPPALKSSIKFIALVIKKDEGVYEDDEIKGQEEPTRTKVAISVVDVGGNGETNGKDIADLKQVVAQVEPAEEKVFDMVEQTPTFSGGTTELMRYIGEHPKYPTIAVENGIQGEVICRPVVGKDEQMRDVTIIRLLDPYCNKGAICVIKLVSRQIPGKQNDKTVAVNFTVPIVFKLQQL